MRPRDLFGVAVRVIGVWILTEAADYAFFSFWKLSGHAGNTKVLIEEDAALFFFYLVLGLVIILLADHIVIRVYGPQLPTQLGVDEAVRQDS